jgi:N-acetylglucosaminyldiphosphoundecaprenol N-acetyl-beta-D-mannosaminyltransferase
LRSRKRSAKSIGECSRQDGQNPCKSELETVLVMQQFSVLGVRVHNTTCHEATAWIEGLIACRGDRAGSVFFVNAHTLNLAANDPSYRAILNNGDLVLADGTGVRWAARLQGVRVLENLPGTDFVPSLFQATAGRGHSYYLLGGDARTVHAAADFARQAFPGWRCAGCHHGYLSDEQLDATVVSEINAARPDVLLVGMGNPLQEQWIHRRLPAIHVPVCMAIGGLFDFWAGNVSRSPRWLRRLGHEWLWRLFQQPRQKASRYLVGNPRFLLRVLFDRLRLRGGRADQRS